MTSNNDDWLHGVGQWLPVSNSWTGSNDQQLFLCPGIPDAGKTILTRFVVENFLDSVKSEIQHTDGQGYHLPIAVEPWAVAYAVVDLAFWVVPKSQVSRLPTLFSDAEQSHVVAPTAPLTPLQSPRYKSKHYREPKSQSNLPAIIPRSWRPPPASPPAATLSA